MFVGLYFDDSVTCCLPSEDPRMLSEDVWLQELQLSNTSVADARKGLGLDSGLPEAFNDPFSSRLSLNHSVHWFDPFSMPNSMNSLSDGLGSA